MTEWTLLGTRWLSSAQRIYTVVAIKGEGRGRRLTLQDQEGHEIRMTPNQLHHRWRRLEQPPEIKRSNQ